MSYIVRDELGRCQLYNGHVVEALDCFSGELRDFNEKDMSFTAVLSTNSVDRMGDVIEIGKSENEGIMLSDFRKNPVILPYHQYNKAPVARAIRIWKEAQGKVQRLVAKIQFHDVTEEARTLFSLYQKKFIKGFSIGFKKIQEKELEVEGDESTTGHPGRHYTKSLLLEASCVPLPANNDCLATVKSYVRAGKLSHCCLKSAYSSLPEDDDELDDLFNIDDLDLDESEEEEIQDACRDILRDFELQRFARSLTDRHGKPMNWGKEKLKQNLRLNTRYEVDRFKENQPMQDLDGLSLAEIREVVRSALKGITGRLD